jgi:alkylation response protein AidB-like acyl-CoA dehydrogenase
MPDTAVLKTPETRPTTGPEILQAVKALHPLLQLHSEAIESGRHLPKEVLEPLVNLGLFRMLVPKAYGGLELHPLEVLEVFEGLAEADASAGWCVMIAAQTGLVSAYMPEADARAIFEDPRAIVGGVFAPTGKAVREGEHYRVNGHWRWGSGSGHSTWMGLGCIVLEEAGPRLLANGQPDPVMVMLPAEALALEDTWHTNGLRGTGSGDVHVKDTLVPVSRSFSLVTDAPRHSGVIYAFPAFGLLAMGIAAVACGNARAALAAFQTLAAGKKAPGARRSLAERGMVQVSFAEAYAKLASARAFLFAEVANAAAEASTGGTLSMTAKANVRLAATHLTRSAAEVVRTVQDLAGGPAVFLDNSLQRRLRDSQTMTAHVMIAPATYELTGRVLLGLPTDDGML